MQAMSVVMMEEEKSKAVELAIAQVERAYGKGALMRIGDGVAQLVKSHSAYCMRI